MFALNILLQKCRGQRKDIFVCFIDYEKALNRVQHEKLIDVLRRTGVDDKDIRIIKNLYWRQKAEWSGVKINGELINTIRYADDTAILCDDLQDLQHLLDLVNEMGPNINIPKTKCMVLAV